MSGASFPRRLSPFRARVRRAACPSRGGAGDAGHGQLHGGDLPGDAGGQGCPGPRGPYLEGVEMVWFCLEHTCGLGATLRESRFFGHDWVNTCNSQRPFLQKSATPSGTNRNHGSPDWAAVSAPKEDKKDTRRTGARPLPRRSGWWSTTRPARGPWRPSWMRS